MTSAAIPTLKTPRPFDFSSRLATGGWVRIFLIMMAVAALLRIVAMFLVPLVPEETYYWMYSQHQSLSYFDHPPMVAWVIGAGTAVFGNTEFGVRIVGHLLMLATSLLLYQYGRMWYSRAVGIFGALALQALPVFFGVGFIATMDSALLFFWVAFLVSLSHVLLRRRTWCWYLAGAALGGAMLSKYTGVFLIAGTGLALILHRPWRRQFRSIHPYLAIAIGLAMFSPVVIWNREHDWASFRFQFINRTESEPLQWQSVLGFIGFQIAVLTPVILVDSGRILVRGLSSLRRLQHPRWLLPLSFGLPLLAALAYKSLRLGIHVNWTLPAFMALLPALGHLLLLRASIRQSPDRRRAILRPVAITALLCAACNIGLIAFLLTAQHRTQLIPAFGPWPEIAAIVEDHEDALEAKTGREPLVIAAGKYRLASVLAFYRDPLESRGQSSKNTTSQWRLGLGEGLGYPYWADPSSWRGDDCIFVVERNRLDELKDVRPAFDRLEIIDDPRLHQLKGGYLMAIGYGLRDLSPALLSKHPDDSEP